MRNVKVRYGPLEYIAVGIILMVAAIILVQTFRPDLWQALVPPPQVQVAPVTVPTAAIVQPQPQPVIIEQPAADPTDVAASQQTDGDEGQEYTKPNVHPLPAIVPVEEVQAAPAKMDTEGTKPARHRLP
jgi:hypothetical protein